MTYNTNKEVLSFNIYMCNHWSKEECIAIFNKPGEDWVYSLAFHLWYKWEDFCDRHGSIGAIPYFVFELDENNLNKLINHACEIYDGRGYRDEKNK